MYVQPAVSEMMWDSNDTETARVDGLGDLNVTNSKQG